jgi:hypothetical protein
VFRDTKITSAKSRLDPPLRGQLRDSQFGRRQRLDSPEREAARSGTRGRQLLADLGARGSIIRF